MKWNRKGTEQKLGTYFVLAIMTATFMLGSANVIGHVNDQYNISYSDDSFGSTYGAVGNLTESTTDLQGFVNETAESSSNALGLMLSGFGTVMKVVGASLNFFTTLIGDLMSEINLPNNFGIWLGRALIATFLAMVGFMLVSAALRWRLA